MKITKLPQHWTTVSTRGTQGWWVIANHQNSQRPLFVVLVVHARLVHQGLKQAPPSAAQSLLICENEHLESHTHLWHRHKQRLHIYSLIERKTPSPGFQMPLLFVFSSKTLLSLNFSPLLSGTCSLEGLILPTGMVSKGVHPTTGPPGCT